MRRLLIGSFAIASLLLTAPLSAGAAHAEAVYIYDNKHLFCVDKDGSHQGEWWIRDYSNTYFYGSFAADQHRLRRGVVTFSDRNSIFEAVKARTPVVQLSGSAKAGAVNSVTRRAGSVTLRDRSHSRTIKISGGYVLVDAGRCYPERG
jgi:hypothetical protein